MIDLLIGTKSITLYLIKRVGGRFHKLSQTFFLNFLNFLKLYLVYSIDLKRQSEHSGLRPDTSSLVFNLKNIVKIRLSKTTQGLKKPMVEPNYERRLKILA